MTHAQMFKFIRAEGWTAFGLGRGWHKDPLKPRGHDTEHAYRIAYKRKAQREARKLRAAGYRYEQCAFMGYRWCQPNGIMAGMDRAEALASIPQDWRAVQAGGGDAV